jgi:hypothetical protein
MKKRISTLLISVLLLGFSPLFTQANSSAPIFDKAERKAQKYLDKPFIAVPILKIEPETGFSFGLNTYYRFKIGKEDSLNGLSILQTAIAYTTEKQLMAGLKAQLFGKKRRTILRFDGRYSYFPYKFWGIGNEIDPQTFAYYYPTILHVDFQYYVKIYRKLYIGIHGKMEDFMKITTDPGFTDLSSSPIMGLGGGSTIGPGWGIWQDSRDNVVNASKGLFLKINHNNMGLGNLGDFQFSKTIGDIRYYKAIKEKTIIALQGYTEWNKGETPFFALAFMGGEQMMRGFYSGAYRAMSMAGLQTEWRRSLSKRIGIVGFVSMGQIATEIQALKVMNTNYAGGVGMRYMFDKKNKLNARLDISFTKESRGIYFGIGEAF